MESSWSILLGLAVINLPFLLIVIIGDRISGQSIKNLYPKDNKIISESELNSTNMNNISPRLKPRLVIYYGANFEAGSVFYPESYTSYGLFKGLSNELNKLVAKKRHSSLMGVIVSFSIGGIVSYSLWKDDEFKELLIELRKY